MPPLPTRGPRRGALEALGLLAATSLMLVAGCRSDTAQPAGSSSTIGAAPSPSSTVDPAGLSDADLAEVLAVVVPAAIEANPDGFGVLKPISYMIADSLGSVASNGDSVTFGAGAPPLSAAARRAISLAVSPGTAVFVTPDPSAAMLLISAPTVVDGSVLVTYEQRCGGEPGALCGSGGSFRLQRTSAGWQVVEVLTGWIS
jgi:hypothetical protein